MSLTGRFQRFFAEANDGARPYPWQCELVERVACTGRWPDIAAPTGTGKSSVIDAHVFLVAEHAAWLERDPDACELARPPRRLVMVAPRRVLVDDQFERARRLALCLRDASEGDALGSVARALRWLCTAVPDQEMKRNDPLAVWRLRGGVHLDSGWRLEPAACQVICATPQMWGSRLLLRGYGATRNARNLESGLLAYDAVAVIDEAHLHERLLETGRRIADASWGSDALQVVGMSATSRSVAGQLKLSEADHREEALRRRVAAVKRIAYVEVEDLKRDAARALSEAAIATKVVGTVGVFVNDVPAALAVSAELRRRGATVETVCGRMRPADLDQLGHDHPGLLTASGNSGVDFLVSTQSLEVGVDLDLPAVVSLIAPPSALAQRAGRLNRSGCCEDSTFTVVTLGGLAQRDPQRPEDGPTVPRSGPYEGADLILGARWLRALGDSISPSAVAEHGLPDVPRPPLPKIRQADLATLLMTSSRQSADPDPGLYIEDPSRSQREISIAARRHLDLEPQVVQEMLRACPPRGHELATFPLDNKAELQEILDRVRSRQSDEERPGAWAVRLVDGDLTVEQVADCEDLRAGDALVVPDGSPICVGRIVGVPPGKGVGGPMHDVLESAAEDAAPDWIVALDAAVMQPLLEIDPTLSGRTVRLSLADALSAGEDEEPGGSHRELASRMRDGRVRLAETAVRWCGGADAERGLLVVHDLRRRGELPNGSTNDQQPVWIDAHNAAVEQRVADIMNALKLDLEAEERQALTCAARHHDSGKAHPRFQLRMGRRSTDPPLAKPLPGHRAGMGDGWRHEQLSAAYVVADGGHDLAVTLVAAHHGRGRALFDRDAADLLAGFDDCPPEVRRQAELLFGEGGRYELLRAAVTRRCGAFRLAWLEALLRCADMQVSKEGR